MFGKCKLKAEIERLKKENETLKNKVFVKDSEIRECLISVCTKLISEYEKVLSDCYIRGPKGRFVKYVKGPTPSFRVYKKDLIGSIEDFPPEVVELMLVRQYEQTGKVDIGVFQENKINSKSSFGFTWEETKERHGFWNNVIYDKNFDVFFEKYPKVLKQYKNKDEINEV